MLNQKTEAVVGVIVEQPSDSSTSESTPLNRHTSRAHDNNSDTSSGITSEPSSVDFKKMENSKRVLAKVVIDFILLCCVGFPILIFFLVGDPYKRGFFCDDESLKHPFKDSTVKSWMLYIIGLVLPIGMIAAVEILRCKLNLDSDNQMKVFNISVPMWVQNGYKYIGLFGFGAACSQLATDIGKYSIGRLRPHFFDVCRPIMLNGFNCSHPDNLQKYIEDFTCSNTESTARQIKEMRLSFPSGHSSFSAYTMIFCALFLHSRMTWKGSKLVKHFLQFCFIMMAWYTGLSRISDYKHHWSDVLSGSILGATVALVIVNYVTDLFKHNKPEKYLPTTRHELNIQNRNGNN